MDDFTISAQKIYVRCRKVEIIGRRILDILSDLLQLKVNCFRLIGDRSSDTGKGHTDIV